MCGSNFYESDVNIQNWENGTRRKGYKTENTQGEQRAENKLSLHNTLLFFCRHKNPVLRHRDIVEQKKREPSHNHKSRSETVLLRCPSSTIKTVHSVLWIWIKQVLQPDNENGIMRLDRWTKTAKYSLINFSLLCCPSFLLLGLSS